MPLTWSFKINTRIPEHIAQRGGKWSISRKNLVIQGSKQLYLVEDVPAYCKGVGLEHL